MTQMAAYETAFSILDTPCPYWIATIFIASLGIGLLLLSPPMKRRALAKHSTVRARTVAAGFLINGLVWTVIGVVLITECASLKDALRAGRVSVIEGTVEDFRPMLVPSNKDESFRVKGRVFRYSDYNLSSGFSTTVSHGGPIREGLTVRISYVSDKIVKLEIFR